MSTQCFRSVPRSRYRPTKLGNKMFITWRKQEQLNWFNVTDFLLANGDELNFILPKFARPLYFFSFFVIRRFGPAINKYC